MPATRRARTSTATPVASGTRPVMLATFDVPFEPEAVEVAVDSAVESGQPLIVVNVAGMPILPVSMSLGYEYLERDELTLALRAPADLVGMRLAQLGFVLAKDPANSSVLNALQVGPAGYDRVERDAVVCRDRELPGDHALRRHVRDQQKRCSREQQKGGCGPSPEPRMRERHP